MLELKKLAKQYVFDGQEIPVIENLNLTVPENAFIALLGPSGCGKTTILKMIAGLESPNSGEILLNNEHVHDPGADRGMVFQDFTLFPWLTVRRNIEFGLQFTRDSEAEKRARVEHYLSVTDLAEFVNFYPKELSGGMQQKVAIARTLATDPDVILMDEPFAALDASTRSKMQEFLVDLWEKEKKTIVFVTHDVHEATFLADEVHVLSPRPARIKRSFIVPFKRPRRHALKRSQEFFEFVNMVSRELDN